MPEEDAGIIYEERKKFIQKQLHNIRSNSSHNKSAFIEKIFNNESTSKFGFVIWKLLPKGKKSKRKKQKLKKSKSVQKLIKHQSKTINLVNFRRSQTGSKTGRKTGLNKMLSVSIQNQPKDYRKTRKDLQKSFNTVRDIKSVDSQKVLYQKARSLTFTEFHGNKGRKSIESDESSKKAKTRKSYETKKPTPKHDHSNKYSNPFMKKSFSSRSFYTNTKSKKQQLLDELEQLDNQLKAANDDYQQISVN